MGLDRKIIKLIVLIIVAGLNLRSLLRLVVFSFVALVIILQGGLIERGNILSTSGVLMMILRG